MEDLINRYRLRLHRDEIIKVYNDLSEVNKVIRYEYKLEDVVISYLDGLVHIKKLNEEIRGLQTEISKISVRCSDLRKSGIKNLIAKGQLENYISVLDKVERNVLLSKDLGLGDLIATIDRKEWKDKSNSKGYM
jgi:hypothetical protein